jgi:hypothetical protein
MDGIIAIAVALAVGFILFQFRQSKRAPIASSECGSPGDDSAESTLQQTLLPLCESVTVDGGQALLILTFSSTLHSISSFA